MKPCNNYKSIGTGDCWTCGRTYHQHVVYDALLRASPWLGKLIAEEVHLKCVAPNAAVKALEAVDAAITEIEKQ